MTTRYTSDSRLQATATLFHAPDQPVETWPNLRWAAQSRRFDERDGTATAVTDLSTRAAASSRYARWVKHYAAGDADALARRLSWDGWTMTSALSRLANPELNDDDGAATAWMAWLRDHLQSVLASDEAVERVPDSWATSGAATRMSLGRSGGSEQAQRDYPAAGLWRAWVERGCRRAGLAADAAFWHAAAPLREHLARSLGKRAVAVLTESAADFKQREPDADHSDWQAWLAAHGLHDVLHSYPVLARQLAEASIDGIDAMAEVARWLHDDRERLDAHFGAAFAVPPVRIESTGSDPHRRGRQVLRLCFAEGVLYLKPRPLAADVAFAALLDDLAAAGLTDIPPHAAALDRGDHGYVAHVPADAIDLAADELQRYHRRAGALIALAWLLNACDLHQDNVIATRAGPVLVDLETLLQPEWPQADGTFDRAQAQSARSCLASGLLRYGQARRDGSSQDASGLRGVAGEARVAWTGLDSLRFTRTVVSVDVTPPHRVIASGHAVDSTAHADAIEAGFVATLDFIASQRDRLLADGGALHALRSLPVRVVLRSSQVYADLLDFLATPAMQRDGALSLIAIDSLNRPFSGMQARPPWWSLVAIERAQLEVGDVPVFETQADANGFPAYGIDAVFARSGFECMRARVAGLGADSIAQQRDLLASALRTTTAAAIPATTPVQAISLQNDVALQHARALGQSVLAAALRGSDGLIAWPQQRAPDSAPVRGFGGDYYLYQGSLGIAWFLAALAACDVQEESRTAAADATSAALRSLARVFENPDAPRLLRNEGFGAAHGLGSLLLGLHALKRIDPPLLSLPCKGRLGVAMVLPFDQISTATSAVESSKRFNTLPTQPPREGERFKQTASLINAVFARIDPQRIAADPDSDLHSGVAGLLLALAAVQRTQPSVELAALAEICIARLHALADADGLPRGYGNVVRSGAAHGLTGIAFALAHAAAAFGRDEWRQWARQLVVAEDQCFDPLQGNWRPQLAGHGDATLNAWCNGAGGILLLRAASGLWRCSEAEIAALARLESAPCAVVDHLCCGLLGRAETLALLGNHLARPALVAAGQRIAAAAMARPTRLDRPGASRLAPGLFRGTSGIGMTLLRLHVDATLPSPLLFGLEPLTC